MWSLYIEYLKLINLYHISCILNPILFYPCLLWRWQHCVTTTIDMLKSVSIRLFFKHVCRVLRYTIIVKRLTKNSPITTEWHTAEWTVRRTLLYLTLYVKKIKYEKRMGQWSDILNRSFDVSCCVLGQDTKPTLPKSFHPSFQYKVSCLMKVNNENKYFVFL